MDMPRNDGSVMWSIHGLLHLMERWFHIVTTDLQLFPDGVFLWMCVYKQIYWLMSESVAMFDSYGVKADMNCGVYRVDQHQPGVTHSGPE